MTILKLSAVAFAVAALGTTALAQSAVGTWTGHIQMSKPPLPPNATPEQKKQAEMGMQMVKKMVFTLDLKKDKSYTVGMAGSKGQNESGTWTQSGKTITLKSAKQHQGPQSQAATLSADGKTLILVPNGNAPAGVKLVFTKK